jgi:hypothetical protein
MLDEIMHLNTWKKKGSISIWRYEPKKNNFPGWHMTADSAGYDSLLELLELLKASAPESKRTLALEVPDRWSASSELKKTAEKKVVIQLTGSEECWKLTNEDGKLFITLNVQGISILFNGIEQAKSGAYDFSVGGINGQNLWFW